MVQQGSPALELSLLPPHQPWPLPALGDPSRNCSCIALHPVTYCVKGCEDFSSTELSASSHSTLPLTSLCLTRLPSVPAGSALSLFVLCGGAAPEQSCLSAVLPTCHELPPSQEPSPAQQHRTSPRQHFLCLLPPPPAQESLEVSLGLQG